MEDKWKPNALIPDALLTRKGEVSIQWIARKGNIALRTHLTLH